MNRKIICLITWFLVLLAMNAFGQEARNVEDDEFNIFLLALASIFFCAIAGVAIAILIITAIVFLLLVGFVSAGILSTSLLIGIYKKSFTAGFKSLIIITACTGGFLLGSIGALFAKYFLHLLMNNITILLIGGLGGLLGGVLIGKAVLKVIQLLIVKFYPAK